MLMKFFIALFFAFTSLPLSSSIVVAQSADTILTKGKILTVDKNFTIAESLAIRSGKIIAVGTQQDIEKFKGPNTQVIELQGRTVIPGLIDNHFHFIRGAWNHQREVRLDGIYSKAAALDKIALAAKKAAEGDWITVLGGWSQVQFQDKPGGFTLTELDTVAPDNPIYIQQSYRTIYVNSQALKAVGKPTTDGAEYRGRTSFRPFYRFISWRNKSSSEKAILKYMTSLNRLGLTTVYDVGRPSEGKLEPVAKLAAKSALPLRVFHTLRYRATDPASLNAAIKLLADGPKRPFSMTDQFGVVGIGEHIYGPMHDRPNRRERWENAVWTPFSMVVNAAAQHGWPIHEHTMSQITVSQFVDLVEDIAKKNPNVTKLRWTLAHALGITEKDLKKAKKFGVAVAIHSQAMMSSRFKNRPPLGSIERSGVLWGLGSDGAIVAPVNPFLTLGWVVTGKNIAGKETWDTDQRLSRKAALIAHTINNAKLLFKEKDLGSLEVGKLADLVILDRDFMTVSAEEIAKIQPDLTMTGGQIVFQK